MSVELRVGIDAVVTSAAQDRERAQAEQRKKILNRLKRARGQLDAVIASVEKEANCKEVITQLSATNSALQRAGFAIVSGAMRECVTDPDDDALSMAELEKLFLSLA